VTTCTIGFLNLQAGAGTTKGYWHYAATFWRYFLPHTHKTVRATAACIRDAGVDVMGFAEIQGEAWSSGFEDQVRLVKDATELGESEFAPTIDVKHVKIGGNAVVSRYPIEARRRVELPGNYPRSALLTEIRVDDVTVTVVTTHLALARRARGKQLVALAELIMEIDGPTVVVGDFNTADETEIGILEYSGVDHAGRVATYPSWKPDRAIDHVFAKGVEVKSVRAADWDVSDHRPIVADVSF
jgi:endonuclease/exonuclease/phosphatase family metal-dependent hydrolase